MFSTETPMEVAVFTTAFCKRIDERKETNANEVSWESSSRLLTTNLNIIEKKIYI